MSRSRASTLWRTQNFLDDSRLIARLVERAAIVPDDIVYDLGAGAGNLTAALAHRARRVIAIEKDPALARLLRRRFAHTSNVAVREADILAHPLPRANYVVFASPPFDITAELVRRLTEAPVPPRDAYLVLQREAAARFSGRPRMTLSAALLGPWFAVDVLHRFRREDFTPPPSVDAVFVRLHKRGPPLLSARDRQLYRDLVVAAYTSRRPSIGDALVRYLGSRSMRLLSAVSGIDARSHPSELTLGDWIQLYKTFASVPREVRRRVRGCEARLRNRQARMQKLHRTRTPRDSLDGHATTPRARILTLERT